MGKEGVHELKNHEWFDGFDWEGLKNGKLKSPIKPMTLDNIDYNVCKTTFDYDNYDKNICTEENMKNLFVGYEHNLEMLFKSVTESTKHTENLQTTLTGNENTNTYKRNSKIEQRDNDREKNELKAYLSSSNFKKKETKKLEAVQLEKVEQESKLNPSHRDTNMSLTSRQKFKLEPISLGNPY